jgi:dephospho-CoA kinase
MLKIGITGGIGSGKTTVCKIFEKLGTPVYYADNEAAKILSDNKTVQQKVISLLGNIIVENGAINRKKIAEIVFSDSTKLNSLNEIIHPEVKKHSAIWMKMHASKPYIIKESAIVFENNLQNEFDCIILVTAPKELKIKRIKERDNSTTEEIEKRIKNQLSDEEKIKLADYVIANDEKLLLTPQIIELHKFFISKQA